MENLRDHPTKHSSLSHDEKFCTLKAKVSLIEVQVNLTEKQVIYTNYNYPVGQNFVGQNFRRAKFSSLFKKFVTFVRQSFPREGSSTRITLNHYFDILKCFVILCERKGESVDPYNVNYFPGKSYLFLLSTYTGVAS